MSGSLGGTAPAVFNAANEECVDAFLAGRLAFTGIVDTVARVVEEHGTPRPGTRLTVEDVLEAETWARARARERGTGIGGSRRMTALMTVLGIVVFAVGLMISIAWHELGHLSTAKLFKIRVPQYMVGFGPTSVLPARRARRSTASRPSRSAATSA